MTRKYDYVCAPFPHAGCPICHKKADKHPVMDRTCVERERYKRALKEIAKKTPVDIVCWQIAKDAMKGDK